MTRQEAGKNQSEGNNPRKERDHRTEYWYKRFIGSIHPDDSKCGLTQTQKPTIKKLITTIVARTQHPGEIIIPLLPTKEMIEAGEGQELWDLLYDLMDATEQVTGERHIYTPSEFVASLKGFSDAQVVRYQDFDEANGDGPPEAALDPARKDILRHHIDQMVDDPAFFEHHTRYWEHRPEYSVYPYSSDKPAWEEDLEQRVRDEKTYITSSELTGQERNRIHGTMRSFDTCNAQSEYLFDHLPTQIPDLGFWYGEGPVHPTVFTHHIVIALPVRDELLTGLQTEGTQIPSIQHATVIDPTLLQLFNYIPFLQDIPHDERIQFVQTVAPGSFSDRGVFVDSFINYIRFLGLVGSYDPGFSFEEYSYRDRRSTRRIL